MKQKVNNVSLYFNSKRLIFIVSILFILVFFVTDVSSAGKKDPSITFSSYEYDFGKVKEGRIVAHIFKFKNNGKGTLIIKKLRAG